MNKKELNEQEVIERLFEVKGYLRAKEGNYHDFVNSVSDAIQFIKDKKE